MAHEQTILSVTLPATPDTRLARVVFHLPDFDVSHYSDYVVEVDLDDLPDGYWRMIRRELDQEQISFS